jgi:hypothetical protein
MPLTLRPTAPVSVNIALIAPPSQASGRSLHLRHSRRSRQSALVLVDDRQRPDDAGGPSGDLGRGSGGRRSAGDVEGGGEPGGARLTSLAQAQFFHLLADLALVPAKEARRLCHRPAVGEFVR